MRFVDCNILISVEIFDAIATSVFPPRHLLIMNAGQQIRYLIYIFSTNALNDETVGLPLICLGVKHKDYPYIQDLIFSKNFLYSFLTEPPP